MVKLSRFCREQLKAGHVADVAPIAHKINYLNKRAKHFQDVLTGPQAACLFANEREDVEGYLRQVLAGVALLRKVQT